ncbi:MAG: cytochrome c biogenesis protein ResB [Nitrospiraceae bacterium]|nr:cytochrome c biogenesis protein ResB [Nitrospiraceae bacterium]
MENKKKPVPNKSLTDRIWALFASVKLAVVIFTLIAMTSIVGTIVEQNADPEKNIKILAKFFGDSAAVPVYNILNKLGFMDMYHSWWFVAFLLAFAANLIICSIDRLPRIWKLVKEPIHPLSADLLEKTSIRRSLPVKAKPAQAKELVRSAMKQIGFTPQEAAGGEAGDRGDQLFAEKGNYSRLGVYITHLSILVILAGAIIGLFFGFNGFLNLPEGETSSVAYKDQGKEIPLGFELRCDNFEVSYYGESDMPKAYKSWLSVYENGKKVMEKAIVVNDPLTYKGITFYQSSFGMVPNTTGKGTIILKIKAPGGQSQDIQAKVGDSFVIPGTSVQGQITDFSPALSLDASGKPFTYDTQLKNPAVFIKFSGPGMNASGWILKRFPQTWALSDGSRVEFLDYWGVEYTGLQVRKDPGVGIVYLGCIAMAIGLFMSFFMSHRRIWVAVSEDKGGSKITIGASAHRNRAAFENRVDKLVALIGGSPKGGNQ